MRRFSLVSPFSKMVLGATCGLLLSLTGAGCGGDDVPIVDETPTGPVCDATKVTGMDNKMATNELKLPGIAGNKPYAYDFDGNGVQENQLKTLINTISLAGLDIQKSVNDAVAGGEAIVLMNVKASDLTKAECAQVTLGLAKGPKAGDPKPTFDGKDKFEIMTEVAPVSLFGPVDAGKMSTLASSKQKTSNKTEQQIQVNIPLGDGKTLPLSLRGAHFEGTLVKDGANTRVKDGMLHGVLAQVDIDQKIVPLVANLLTDMVNKDPTAESAKIIIGLFENQADPVSKKKCTDKPADCCATNGKTCKILPEEVKNSAVGGVLSADVQVFDDQGNWAPVPGGKKYNGMSVGIGFSGVTAQF